MSAMRRLRRGLVFVFVCVTLRAFSIGAENKSELRLLLVQGGEASPAHFATMHTFANAFRVAIASQSAAVGVVQMEDITARDAAKRFKAGRCDAIVVLGADRPRALRRLDATTLAGDLGRACCYDAISLIVAKNEDVRQQSLANAFSAALRHAQRQTGIFAAR